MTSLSPFLPHLLTTLARRPYVFVFLIVFLIFSLRQFGAIRTFFFLFFGWVVAFVSEVSSIRNGFPYGEYHYIYENLKGELILWGVPLWDSLSYTFLAYASFSTALFLCLEPTALADSQSFLKNRTRIRVLLLTLLLMTGIDVVIDPLAHRGDEWFLGKIYYYPPGGSYFDVPISNFIGWALVATLIGFCFQRFDGFMTRAGHVLNPMRWQGINRALGVLLYLGVFVFNFGITLWLKLWKIAAFDLLLLLPLLWGLKKKIRL